MRIIRSRGWRAPALRGAAVALAATSVLALAAPAQAFYIAPYAGNCGSWGSQRCTGAGQSLPIGTSSLTVTFECTAVTPFVVNSTGVGCYLLGDDGYQYAHTGPYFTTGQQSTVSWIAYPAKFQGYRICVGAGYLTSSGYFQAVQGYSCSVSPVST